jgi:hypothetical protein
MIFNLLTKLEDLFGIKNFVVDLCFVPPNRNFIQNIYKSLEERKNFEDSFRFNLKKGLK